MTLTLPLTIAGLIALGVLAQWVAWRLKLPAILLLLLLGLGLGPWLHLYNPDELLGELLFPVVSMSVAIILFEGSLTLKLDQIREHGQVVTRLITLGDFSPLYTCCLSRADGNHGCLLRGQADRTIEFLAQLIAKMSLNFFQTSTLREFEIVNPKQ